MSTVNTTETQQPQPAAVAPGAEVQAATLRAPEHVFLIAGANEQGPTFQAALIVGIRSSELDADGVYRREAHILFYDRQGFTPIILHNVPHGTQIYDGAASCWLWPYEVRKRYPRCELAKDNNRRTPEQLAHAGRERVEGARRAGQI
jgi:hypothetical protein